MKRGNFWMTTIGAGVVIAGMMTAGRAALQSPAFLFLAGQLKVAAGQTDEGMRLMNAAASQRESGTVHAAEPAAKTVEVCTKKTTEVAPKPNPVVVRPVKASAPKAAPAVLVAKLDFPAVPLQPSAQVPAQFRIDPVAFRYMNDADRARIIEAQVQAQMAQREKMKQLRHMAHNLVLKYAPAAPGFNPADIYNMEKELPAALGQVAQ